VRLRSIILVVLLFATSATANLVSSSNPVVDICKDLSFPEGRSCAAKVVEEQEQSMRSAYGDLREKLVESRIDLEKSQVAWEAYRTAQCKLEHGNRSEKLHAFRICSARLAKSRAEELRAIPLGCNACIE
jgi:uncharacterized protein YecT (DUF1311 family)